MEPRGASWIGGMAAVLALLGAGAPSSAQETAEPLYTLHDLGAVEAVGIDGFGRVLVQERVTTPRALLAWIDDEGDLRAEQVDGLTAGEVVARAISPSGTVVGVCNAGQVQTGWEDVAETIPYYVQYRRAFSASGGAATDLGALQILDYPGYVRSPIDDESEAFAVNASGVAVGQSTQLTSFCHIGQCSTFRAVRWSGGQVTRLSTAEGRATCVDGAGRVLGWVRGLSAQSVPQQRIVLWDAAGQHDVDLADSDFAAPTDLSDAGRVVGSRLVRQLPNPPRNRAFVARLNGTATLADHALLPLLPGAEGLDSGATAVDESGTVVGWSATGAPGVTHAVRWIGGAVEDLNAVVDPDSPDADEEHPWVLTRAVGLNEEGEVACVGTRDGALRSYLLRPLLRGVVARPRLVDFHEVDAGGTAEATTTITNATAAPVVVKLGGIARPFTVVGPRTFKLAAGAQQVVRLRAAPRDEGPATASLPVTVAGHPPLTLDASLVAVGPVEVTPSPLAFGSALERQKVTLRNRRQVPVRATLSGLKGAFTLTGPNVVDLAPEGTAETEVEFGPDDAREFAGTLVVRTDVPKTGTSTVPVTGTGTAANQVATLAAITGRVEIQIGTGAWERAVPGMKLRKGFKVHTGFKATARLSLPRSAGVRRSDVDLGPLTMVQLEDLATTGGRVLIQLGALTHEVQRPVGTTADFQTKTPTTTASIRGTDYDVLWDAVAQVTVVSVRKGLVEVAPVDGVAVPVPAGSEVECTATQVGPLVPLGRAGAHGGSVGRVAARALVAAALAKAEKRCGLVSRTTSIGMLPTADGWDVTVGTDAGTSRWTVTGKRVLPADEAAEEIASRCR